MMQWGADASDDDDDGITNIYWGLTMCLAPSTHDLSGPSHQPLENRNSYFQLYLQLRKVRNIYLKYGPRFYP